VPHVGDEYQIFQYGSATGGFGEWRGLDAGNGVEYLPEYGTKALVLRGAEATPPAVVEAVPAGAIDRFSTFVVSFNKALSNSSVGSNDFQLATRAGNISASSVTRIAPERYRLRFPEQEIEGVYELTIGPAIEDAAGNAMAAAHVHTV